MADIEDAFASVEAAIRAHGAAPDEVLASLEMLRGSVGRWLAGATGALDAPSHGRWLVTPAGRQIDLVRRPTLRRLVCALVDARVAKPGKPVSASDLITVGWADEPAADHEAAMNRLRVAICRLRQLGLESLIVTTSHGWLIDPTTPIIRDATHAVAAPASEPEIDASLDRGGERKPASGLFASASVEEREERHDKVA